MASQYIAPNLSRIIIFIRGLEAAVPRYIILPRSQQRDKTVYIISASLSLSPHSMQLATPVDQSYQRHYRYRNIHEGTVPSTYRSTAAISRNAPFLLFQSIAVPQAVKLHPSRGAPNDVDVLSRSRRSICYAHIMIAVAARLRLISPIPSLVNRRGNILHAVDINTTWYVHREGVP
jgi:hypothetical protein